jgi:hypothetical protein
MAQLQQVTINESSEDENISLEEQAALQDAANADKPADTPAPQTEEETRPEWLPEKFQSPEDLAKAYSELEKKGSTSKKASKEEAPAEEPNTMSTAIETATSEFMESGELSDKTFETLEKAGLPRDITFETLEKAGLPRDIVEAYMAGQGALVATQVAQVKETIGGEGNYEAMAEWAAENLAEEELSAYNEVVENGTVEQARMAVRGLFAQFRSAGGKAPTLIQGSTTGSGVKPFGSAAQVTEAMRDPRYKNDPAYRQTVEQRLAVTTAF